MEKIHVWEVAPQGPERNCIQRELGLKKGTTALFWKGACQRKKAEQLLRRGNDIQMFVHVIPRQGDVFGCLGSKPRARSDTPEVAVMYNGLP